MAETPARVSIADRRREWCRPYKAVAAASRLTRRAGFSHGFRNRTNFAFGRLFDFARSAVTTAGAWPERTLKDEDYHINIGSGTTQLPQHEFVKVMVSTADRASLHCCKFHGFIVSRRYDYARKGFADTTAASGH